MSARIIGRIETNVERGAAALFAVSVSYPVHMLSQGRGKQVYALAAALVAYLACALVLGVIARSKPRLRVPVFDLRDFEELEGGELLLTDQVQDELVLTDEDRVGSTKSDTSEPLVLDDVLAAVDADSRVVRLFDRRATPTPGQLSSKIEHHLERGSCAPQGDAAQALSDALAELRRSLR